MIVEQVLMTPSMAKSLLAGNDKNRSLSENRISVMAALMKAGQWALNGQTIVVGESGRLLDGQHRLCAVVVAGADVPMLIVRGAAETALDTIDTGRARSTKDIVGLSGHRNAPGLAASAVILYKLLSGISRNVTIPPSYALTTIDRFPSLDGWVDAFRHSPAGRLIGGSALVPMLVYLSDIAERPELAASLLHGIATGERLLQGAPVLTLRNRLIRIRGEGHSMTVVTCWTAVVRTVDAMEAGEKIERLMATKTEGKLTQPERLGKHLERHPEGLAYWLHDLPAPVMLGTNIRNQKDVMAKIVSGSVEENVRKADALKSKMKGAVI